MGSQRVGHNSGDLVHVRVCVHTHTHTHTHNEYAHITWNVIKKPLLGAIRRSFVFKWEGKLYSFADNSSNLKSMTECRQTYIYGYRQVSFESVSLKYVPYLKNAACAPKSRCSLNCTSSWGGFHSLSSWAPCLLSHGCRSAICVRAPERQIASYPGPPSLAWSSA